MRPVSSFHTVTVSYTAGTLKVVCVADCCLKAWISIHSRQTLFSCFEKVEVINYLLLFVQPNCVNTWSVGVLWWGFSMVERQNSRDRCGFCPSCIVYIIHANLSLCMDSKSYQNFHTTVQSCHYHLFAIICHLSLGWISVHWRCCPWDLCYSLALYF